jgi:hypothetical protein
MDTAIKKAREKNAFVSKGVSIETKAKYKD